jgi:hypothetical protein
VSEFVSANARPTKLLNCGEEVQAVCTVRKGWLNNTDVWRRGPGGVHGEEGVAYD